MTDFVNEFSISKTRIENFNTCLRKYYYRHYGFWRGWEQSAIPLTRELYALTKLSSRPQWIGTVVHDAIDEVATSIQREQPISVGKAISKLRSIMRQQWNGSLQAMQSGWFLQAPKQVAEQTAALQEHYYGISSQTRPEDFASDVEQAEQCLRNFYQTSVFGELSTPGVVVIPPDDFPSTMVNDIKVWGKIDLMYRRPDGKLVVVDWKTGQDIKPSDIFNQLFTYAVYAVHEEKTAPEAVELRGIDLYKGQEHCRDFDTYWYDATIRNITATASELRKHLVDPVNNMARIEDFPMTNNHSVCGFCPFKGPCSHERDIAAATG